jgi:hypothetical protein
MKVETLLNVAMVAFRQKFREICPTDAATDLSSESFSSLCRILQQAFSTSGTTALKAYLESFDSEREVLFREGILTRFKKVSAKEFLTPFGWVAVDRRLYQSDSGGDCHCPLDEKWAMRGETLTPMVREAVNLASAHNTPEEVELLLHKCALFHPSRTAVQHATKAFGRFWNEHGEAILSESRKTEVQPNEAEALVVSLDGVNVLMREEGKKRGRKRSKPKAMGPSEASKTSYQNAMVGSVSLYRSPKKDEEGPVRLQSRYVSRMPEEGFGAFRKSLEAEVVDTLDGFHGKRILLLDGSRALWNYATTCPTYAGFTHVVDFYHASEYLAKAAEAAFGKATYESQGWYRKWKECLLKEDGAAQRILRAMGYLQRSRKLMGDRKKRLGLARTFFRNNLDKMGYAEQYHAGHPVGSGPVEAACKSIVKSRMCRSGMRWTPKGGAAILALRTLVKSNRWDTCWSEYEALKHAA